MTRGQTVNWSYDPRGGAFMTLEREGCDCPNPNTKCPKPLLCCFACSPGCRDVATLHAGNLGGHPGETRGTRDRSSTLIGESVQPMGGGGITPIVQVMDRADPNVPSSKPELFAATKGPTFLGGCTECCLDSKFQLANASPEDDGNVRKIKSLKFGDFATITKRKQIGRAHV